LQEWEIRVNKSPTQISKMGIIPSILFRYISIFGKIEQLTGTTSYISVSINTEIIEGRGAISVIIRLSVQ